MSKCKRCHKEIKNPKSVQNGYGPVCWSKIAAHPVAVGKTSTEKSFVPIFIKQIKKNQTKDKESDKPQSGDENKATTWTDMYGIIHILESGN